MLNFASPFAAASRRALGLALASMIAFPAHADETQDARKLFQSGQHAQALARVNKALAEKPDNAQARFLKGVILAEQGSVRDAIDVFVALTQDHPELPEPHNNLAVLYASQGQYERARVSLERSIRTHPSYATAYENLGDVYAKLASRAYDKALQLDSGNAGAQSKLALARELVGEPPRAQRTAVLAAAAPAPAPEKAPPSVEKAAPATPEKAAAAPAARPQPAPLASVPPPRVSPVPEVASVASAPPPKRAAAPQRDVAAAIASWARAWSNRDAKAYLSYYDRDFVLPPGMSRAEWERTRRARITGPKSIAVTVSTPKISVSPGGLATATFRQSYRSDVYKANSTKTLLMVNVDGRWLIRQERAAN